MTKKRIILDKDIGYEGITAEAFRQSWPADAGEVELIINSAGGSCTDGIAIAEFIRTKRAEGTKVNAKVIGLCGSIATMIALSCDRLEMSPMSQFFIHESRCGVEGTADQLASAQKELELYNDLMLKAYKDKTKMDEGQIKKMMASETIMSAEQAKSMGFIDSITQFLTKAVAMFKADKKDAQGHVYITINQAEESPGAVQTGESASEGTEEMKKEETPVTVESVPSPAPAPQVTELPAPSPTPATEPVEDKKTVDQPCLPTTEEVETMRAKISTLEAAIAEMKYCNDTMKAEAAKAEADIRQSTAMKAKLGEFSPPPRPKYEAVKTSTVKAHTANTMQVF